MADQMIMEEVACLFVEQYEAMFHKDYIYDVDNNSIGSIRI